MITECETCLRTKFTNKVNYNTNNSNNFQYLSKVTSDLCGPITPLTYNNYRYFITFLDKATRYLEVELLRTKDEAYNSFYNFKQRAENNKDNHKIRIYATDNGREFVNNKFKKILLESGIKHQLSPAYTHEPNGLAERINRTIMDKVRSLIFNSNTIPSLWGEALLAAVYLYNRTPHSSLNYKTPYELIYKEKPNISNIRVWGSITYYKNKGNNIKKLEPKANKGILIGYGQNQYRIWSLELNKPIWSRDVKILENNFINTSSITNDNSSNQTELEINNKANNHENRDTVPKGPISSNSDLEINNHEYSDNNNNTDLSSDNNTNNDNYNNIDESLDELALVLLNTIDNEPNTYKQALESLNKDDWINAMNNEIKELESQNTWSITSLPLNRSALRGKWVYKIKTNNQGNIIKYKARWVIKGFN